MDSFAIFTSPILFRRTNPKYKYRQTRAGCLETCPGLISVSSRSRLGLVSVSSRSRYAYASSRFRTLKVSENGHVSIETCLDRDMTETRPRHVSRHPALVCRYLYFGFVLRKRIGLAKIAKLSTILSVSIESCLDRDMKKFWI